MTDKRVIFDYIDWVTKSTIVNERYIFRSPISDLVLHANLYNMCYYKNLSYIDREEFFDLLDREIAMIKQLEANKQFEKEFLEKL